MDFTKIAFLARLPSEIGTKHPFPV